MCWRVEYYLTCWRIDCWENREGRIRGERAVRRSRTFDGVVVYGMYICQSYGQLTLRNVWYWNATSTCCTISLLRSLSDRREQGWKQTKITLIKEVLNNQVRNSKLLPFLLGEYKKKSIKKEQIIVRVKDKTCFEKEVTIKRRRVAKTYALKARYIFIDWLRYSQWRNHRKFLRVQMDRIQGIS